MGGEREGRRQARIIVTEDAVITQRYPPQGVIWWGGGCLSTIVGCVSLNTAA